MEKYKWITTLLLVVLLIGAGALLLWRTGFFAAAASLEGIQSYFEKFSPYSQIVFFAVQLVSVIIAPIPSNLSAAAGALIFGVWESFFMTVTAVILGSMAVFFLARALGQEFTQHFVSEKVSGRYLDVLKRKRDVVLALVFLFPFFPDDLICILAGLTDISWPRFLAVLILFRPWGLLVACGVGGSVISIPLWGMALIGAGGVLLFLIGVRYGDRIEKKVLDHIKKQ